MLGLLTPYSEELLYSTIARAGVHDGETSPKQLLDKVFFDRKVIATVDLPCHIQELADQYPDALGLDVQTLISRHTLWPVYAPFQPREKNQKIVSWMSGRSQGAVHLASGVAASRVKSKRRLLLCAACLEEQKLQHGECFWNRHWQVPLVKTCPIHGPLNATSIELNGEHRHAFIPVEAVDLLEAEKVTQMDFVFGRQIAKLLQVKSEGISYAQWTSFYKNFAASLDFTKGSRADHAAIHLAVTSFWGGRWLGDAGLLPTLGETSWLRSLFRKHRKSFSFAEHIVAILALSNGGKTVLDAINTAAHITPNSGKRALPMSQSTALGASLTSDQVDWQRRIEASSPTLARRESPALYARLYRNRRDWLMSVNSRSKMVGAVVNNRVNWAQRDGQVAEELRAVCESLSLDKHSPKLSKAFLIQKLSNRATVEKNLHRLPRCSALLDLYAEGTAEFQVRRLTREYKSALEGGENIRRWSLLRKAGLSDERITDLAADWLKELLGGKA